MASIPTKLNMATRLFFGVVIATGGGALVAQKEQAQLQNSEFSLLREFESISKRDYEKRRGSRQRDVFLLASMNRKSNATDINCTVWNSTGN